MVFLQVRDDLTKFFFFINSSDPCSDRDYPPAFSPDCQSVVSGSLDKTVRLWSVESGALLRTMEGNTDWVKSVDMFLFFKIFFH